MVAQGLHIAVLLLHAFSLQVSSANVSNRHGMPDLAGFGLGQHSLLPKGTKPHPTLPTLFMQCLVIPAWS